MWAVIIIKNCNPWNKKLIVFLLENDVNYSECFDCLIQETKFFVFWLWTAHLFLTMSILWVIKIKLTSHLQTNLNK
jgi:hypothetical protein